MNEQDWLAERFEDDRARPRAVAYRMLGLLGEAYYAQIPSEQWWR